MYAAAYRFLSCDVSVGKNAATPIVGSVITDFYPDTRCTALHFALPIVLRHTCCCNLCKWRAATLSFYISTEKYDQTLFTFFGALNQSNGSYALHLWNRPTGAYGNNVTRAQCYYIYLFLSPTGFTRHFNRINFINRPGGRASALGCFRFVFPPRKSPFIIISLSPPLSAPFINLSDSVSPL